MQTSLLALLAVLFFVVSVVQFLRAEWYRQQVQRQGLEFTAGLQALLAGQTTRRSAPSARDTTA